MLGEGRAHLGFKTRGRIEKKSNPNTRKFTNRVQGNIGHMLGGFLAKDEDEWGFSRLG